MGQDMEGKVVTRRISKSAYTLFLFVPFSLNTSASTFLREIQVIFFLLRMARVYGVCLAKRKECEKHGHGPAHFRLLGYPSVKSSCGGPPGRLSLELEL